jgi:MinD-like ATPase involved in chromosome partitioning or flagellar assembly
MSNFERLNELAELPDEWREFVFNELMSEEEREEVAASLQEFISQTMEAVRQVMPFLHQLAEEITGQFSQVTKSIENWRNSLPPELVAKMATRQAGDESR